MTDTGALPPKPCRNLNMKTLCKFCATATGIWKTVNKKNPIVSGSFRPYSSDSGPQRVGPVPNPRMNNDVASTMSSGDTSKCSAVWREAALNIELAKVAHKVGVAYVWLTSVSESGRFSTYHAHGNTPFLRKREVLREFGIIGPVPIDDDRLRPVKSLRSIFLWTLCDTGRQVVGRISGRVYCWVRPSVQSFL